jgi:hypothetical protein
MGLSRLMLSSISIEFTSTSIPVPMSCLIASTALLSSRFTSISTVGGEGGDTATINLKTDVASVNDNNNPPPSNCQVPCLPAVHHMPSGRTGELHLVVIPHNLLPYCLVAQVMVDPQQLHPALAGRGGIIDPTANRPPPPPPPPGPGGGPQKNSK